MSKTLTNKLYLKKQLYALQMGENINFLSHLNVLNGLITQLANLGVKIEDEDKAIVLLNSLPSSYDTLATTILHGKDSIELKDVTSALLLNEKMRKRPENHGQALIMESRAEVTKGAQVTMVDPELVESPRSDQNRRPEIATIAINQDTSKEIVQI